MRSPKQASILVREMKLAGRPFPVSMDFSATLTQPLRDLTVSLNLPVIPVGRKNSGA